MKPFAHRIAVALSICLTASALFSAPVARADVAPLLQSQVPTLAPMLKKVLPAVVNIRTIGHVEAQQSNPRQTNVP